MRARAQLEPLQARLAAAEAEQRRLAGREAALAHLQRLPAEVEGLKVPPRPCSTRTLQIKHCRATASAHSRTSVPAKAGRPLNDAFVGA